MKRCERCGKSMWFFQDLIMTTNRFGEVVIPISHDKCDDGKPYYAKRGNNDE